MQKELEQLIVKSNERRIVEKFITEFHRIKSLNYIDATNRGNRAVGDTFEYNLGLPSMRNSKKPDYEDLIEIKARASRSPLSLFTKIFDYPPNANEILCKRYGKIDDKTKVRKLFTTVRADDFNSCYKINHFKLEINLDQQKIFLKIKKGSNDEIEQEYFFLFNEIDEIIKSKLQWIAIVNAKKQKDNNLERFWYHELFLVNKWNLDDFLECLSQKKIKYDLRKGIYLTGKKKGLPHDYGFAFRLSNAEIKKEKLEQIFSTVIHIV